VQAKALPRQMRACVRAHTRHRRRRGQRCAVLHVGWSQKRALATSLWRYGRQCAHPCGGRVRLVSCARACTFMQADAPRPLHALPAPCIPGALVLCSCGGQAMPRPCADACKRTQAAAQLLAGHAHSLPSDCCERARPAVGSPAKGGRVGGSPRKLQ